MRLKLFLAVLVMLTCATAMHAQANLDVMGMHNLGPGSKSPISGARSDACAYCHAPHSGLNMGLWNQKLTTKNYTMYKSTTEKNVGVPPVLASDSNMCLSCHDGTVAPGTTVAYGKVTMMGSMDGKDVFSGTMQSSHPFSLETPLQDSVHLAASLKASGVTTDPGGAVKLIKGSVECTSCHNPHIQAKDQVSQNFLVKDGSGGQLCLACHDPSRTVSGAMNPLADWSTSAHAISANKISSAAGLGNYTTVAADACISCHTPHNAALGDRILRGENEDACISCHNGSANVAMAQYTNVFGEYQSPKVGHPMPTTTSNPHDAAEKTLLDNNRHATCVDCHSGHGSQPVQVFPGAPLIRVSQKNVLGISASDGTTVLTPAVNQYESCLRCHGASAGKQTQPIYGYAPVRAVSAGDQLNLVPQFALAATSSHPVVHQRNSPLSQDSLLPNMMNLDGINPGRDMGTQILCTDCHNSDDNREFGGKGANGPHGSIYTHILERRYEMSQAPVPGQAITNTFQNPDLITSHGPYAMCAKCHDLQNKVNANTTWAHHSSHISTAGLSCSVCHTAHGMGANSGAISGKRLVNFDLNVVAANGNNAISYTYVQGGGTCVLVCHAKVHNPDGTVTNAAISRGPVPVALKK